MKRKTCVFIFLIINISIVFGQTEYEPVPLIVGFDTQIWKSGLRDIRTISKGEPVYPYYGPYIYDSINGKDYAVNIRYNDAHYYILANVLALASGDSLPESWLTPIDAPKKWIISYYLDALRTGSRETFFKYERPWMEYWFELIANDEHSTPFTWMRWFEEKAIHLESLVFNTAGLTMGGFEVCPFFVHTITPFENGYRITVSADDNFIDIPAEIRLPFPRYSERKVFDLIFIPDGDYMDVYLDSPANKLASFAKVDSVFITEIENLFRSNTYDTSKITSWPRRANGTMDYPPPVDMSNYQTTHHTTDNLRLRDEANTSSLMVTTLSSGSAVQVLETGEIQTIDGITAPWVKVLSESGYTGWCFSGYLEAIPKEESVIIPINETPEPTENDEPVRSGISDTNIFDMPIPLAVGGGIIVIAVGIILVVKRKKKN